MKKMIIATFLMIALAIASFSPVSADPGGMPGAHGVDGKTFGMVVSNLAQSSPGAVADHVNNSGGNGSGMPAAHGVDGKTFGGAVSGLARMYPGAVADHVSGK